MLSEELRMMNDELLSVCRTYNAIKVPQWYSVQEGVHDTLRYRDVPMQSRMYGTPHSFLARTKNMVVMKSPEDRD